MPDTGESIKSGAPALPEALLRAVRSDRGIRLQSTGPTNQLAVPIEIGSPSEEDVRTPAVDDRCGTIARSATIRAVTRGYAAESMKEARVILGLLVERADAGVDGSAQSLSCAD